MSEPRTALVHDYLLVMRGAERTFKAMADCWPDAPIYTLLYDAAGTGNEFSERRVETSFLQRLGVRQSGFRRLLPLFPQAVERLDVGEYDVLVSSSSAFAHGVRPRPGAIHVCYCHSPFRYAWHERHHTVANTPRPLRLGARVMLGAIRSWDRAASRRVTHYLTNSEVSRQRIWESYRREATVVYPPVAVDRFSVGEPHDYFLVVTELVGHKRVEIALEAARRAGQPIKVVGSGPSARQLEREFGAGASFLGRVSDTELEKLYRHARALIVPNIEEFGIAAVEAQASGRPVLAADGGGVRETVLEGETGIRVPKDDATAIAEAIADVDWDAFDGARIREHAQTFSTTAFQRRLTGEIARITGESVPGSGAPAVAELPKGV